MPSLHKQNVNRIIYILAVVIISIYFISPFIISIILAGTLAMTLYPLMLKLEKKGIKRKTAAGLVTAGFTILLSIPFFFFVAKGTVAVTAQLEAFSQNERFKDQGVQNIINIVKHDVVKSIQKFGGRFHIDSYLTDAKVEGYIYQTNQFFLSFFQEFALSLPTIFLLFLVMVLCIYSFLCGATSIRSFFQSIFGFDDMKMDHLVASFIDNSRQVYISNIITGAIQSLLIASAVAILGLGDFFLIFFVTLILSFVPVIGAAPVGMAFAVYAYFTNATTAAIILVVLSTFTGLVDNILRPYLASFGESKIPAVASFVCVIGGAIMLGFPGLFLGLLAGAIAYDTLPIFWNGLERKATAHPELLLEVQNNSDSNPLDEARH